MFVLLRFISDIHIYLLFHMGRWTSLKPVPFAGLSRCESEVVLKWFLQVEASWCDGDVKLLFLAVVLEVFLSVFWQFSNSFLCVFCVFSECYWEKTELLLLQRRRKGFSSSFCSNSTTQTTLNSTTAPSELLSSHISDSFNTDASEKCDRLLKGVL